MKFFEKILLKEEAPEDKLRKRILTEPAVKRFLDDFITNPNLENLEMYMVGGIVRDTLLDKLKSKDFDFIFRKISGQDLEKALTEEKGSLDLVGKHFGVYKFMPEDKSLDEPIDIAFPRTEFSTGGGGKKDFEVQSDPNMPVEEDLGRRDLTINAMAYDVREGKLVDPYDGKKDLENKLIRAVGKPEDRFKEDYSRMLRAIRFACRFDFQIEKNTWKAIIENAQHINDTVVGEKGKKERKVPEDTIRKELLKSLKENSERAFDLYDKASLWQQIIPELNKLKNCTQPAESHQEGDVWQHTKLMLEKINSPEFKSKFPNAKISPEFTVAIMLSQIGKPKSQEIVIEDGDEKIKFKHPNEQSAQLSEKITRRLKFSNKQIKEITFLIRNLLEDPGQFSFKDIENAFFGKHGNELLMLTYLDSLSSIKSDGQPNTKRYDELMTKIEKVRKRIEARQEQKLPKTILSSDDINEIFFERRGGIYFGLALTAVQDAWLNGEINSKKQAMKYLQNHKQEILDQEKQIIESRKKKKKGKKR